MKVSGVTRMKAYELVASGWRGKLINSDGQIALTDATIDAFEDQINYEPDSRPDDATIRQRVKQDPRVKTFIPAWILTVLAGWVIQKLLDWLWDRYNDQQ
jgi:hypothetical protein